MYLWSASVCESSYMCSEINHWEDISVPDLLCSIDMCMYVSCPPRASQEGGREEKRRASDKIDYHRSTRGTCTREYEWILWIVEYLDCVHLLTP